MNAKREQIRKAYTDRLPALRAKYRAYIAQAAATASKIHRLEAADEVARAAEPEPPYGQAANQ